MHPAKHFCTEYEKSKVIADKIVLDAAAEGVPIVPMYPGVIYGPGKVTTGNLVAHLVNARVLVLVELDFIMPIVPVYPGVFVWCKLHNGSR